MPAATVPNVAENGLRIGGLGASYSELSQVILHCAGAVPMSATVDTSQRLVRGTVASSVRRGDAYEVSGVCPGPIISDSSAHSQPGPEYSSPPQIHRRDQR